MTTFNRSKEDLLEEFNRRSEADLAEEFERRFDDGLTPEEAERQKWITEGYELRDKEFREASQQKQQSPLKVIRASDIKPQRQKWLYKPNNEGVIPLQTGTVFAGIGGEGKSSFAIYLAALLSRGALEGDLQGQKHGTIIFGPEDDWATAMVPRLIASGADRDHIYKVTAETLTQYGVQERELKFPLDIQHLDDVVKENDVKLIVVDPISTSMAGDMNKVQDVRDALGALTALAQRHDLAVIAINHFKKGGSSLADKMSGSHAMRDVVRSYLAFATDEETGERVITQDKSNYSQSTASWKFVLDNTFVEVEGEDAPAEIPAVRMLGASDVTVKDLIDREHGEYEDDRHEADQWLIEVLTEAGGSMAVKEIKASAAQAGFTFKTLQNRRSKIRNPKVKTGRNGFGKDSIPFWEIEEESPIDPTYVPAQKTSGPMGPMDNESGSMPIHPIHPVHPEHDEAQGSIAPCPLHGTDHLPECYTCDLILKETA